MKHNSSSKTTLVSYCIDILFYVFKGEPLLLTHRTTYVESGRAFEHTKFLYFDNPSTTLRIP